MRRDFFSMNVAKPAKEHPSINERPSQVPFPNARFARSTPLHAALTYDDKNNAERAEPMAMRESKSGAFFGDNKLPR